jgi:hypothetical protein
MSGPSRRRGARLGATAAPSPPRRVEPVAALVDGQRSRGAPTGWLNRAGVIATINASSGFIGGRLPVQQTSKGKRS